MDIGPVGIWSAELRYGDAAAIAKHVRQHLDAGADQVCVQIASESRAEMPLSAWRRLAPALLG